MLHDHLQYEYICGKSVRLEELNLSAIRCISGCKVGTNHDRMYAETSLQPLHARQVASQLMMAFDAYHEHRPCRLGRDLFVTVGGANPYGLMQSTKLRPIKCKTERYRSSFLPSAISLLNLKLSEIPNLLSVNSRIQYQCIIVRKPVINDIYMYQFSRRSAVLLARLRCGNSDLNAHLHIRQLSDTMYCDSCDTVENVYHYFIKCTKYDRLRQDCVEKIPLECLNIENILH